MLLCMSLRVLYVLYGTLITICLVVRLIAGDVAGWVSLFSSIVPTVLFPALPILAWAAVKRRIIALLWSVAVIGLLAIWYGSRFAPTTILTEADSVTCIKVLSHNIGQDLSNYEYVTKMIRESGADVVLLQEVTDDFIRYSWPQLADIYPFQAHGPLLSRKLVGMGILSRHSLRNVHNFRLDAEGIVFQQRAEVAWNRATIVIYNIHTTFPWVYWRTRSTLPSVSLPAYEDLVRRREIQSLVRLVSHEVQPVVLAGDFNLSDFSGDYQLLTEYAVDSYSERGYGFGFTWPANRTPSVNIPIHIPLIRIDYVFHSQSLQGVSAIVLPPTGSDHRPLLAEMTTLPP
jgi:vancomycin resistance protein VanJ